MAEFEYRPVACKKAYRVIVLRKKLVVEKGQLWLFEPDRYFFYITNDRTTPASEIVFLANDRCDQENLIAQLKGGVKALAMPVDDLVSNWAYMVMASLAWSLKAWAALLLPEHRRWAEKHRAEKRSLLRMEFCDVLRGVDPGAVPGRADEPADRVPAAVVEPVAGGVPAAGGAVARSLGCVERRGSLKPESGCSGPCGLRTDERRWGDGTARARRWNRVEATRPGGTPYPARPRLVRRERLTLRLFSD